jgi:hypothetical protein
MRLSATCLLLSICHSLAVEPADFAVGLDAKFAAVSARVPGEAFNPLRKKTSVLILSETMPGTLTHPRRLISWAPLRNEAEFDQGGQAYTNYEQYLLRWIRALAPDAIVTQNTYLTAVLGDSLQCFDSLAEIPDHLQASALRKELAKRESRTPIEVAEAVSQNYGRRLKSINYQTALAMVGRARLAQLKAEDAGAELAAKISGATVAGYLIFAELGIQDRVMAAAAGGRDNPGHNEMSDSVFMVCPILAAAGRTSGDETFYTACIDHLKLMRKLCLRPDGLYRHSPLDEAAWGRGNGFPALGLAWVLAEMPEEVDGRPLVLDAFRHHIAALAKHQDASGMWHQVIDHPGSYREFTCTCMITYAVLRGMREGWLDREEYQAIADRGWRAIKLRISLDGKSFTDACTGTGKQRSLQDYFLRTAILGPDERSGGMAMMVATERALWERR